MRKILLLLVISCLSFTGYSQSDKSYVTAGAGFDFLSFRGDLNKNQKISPLNNFRGGFNFFVEKRFLGLFGFSANGLFGKISQYENSSVYNLYFQSKIMQFDARVSLYLDNKYLLGHETLFTPYLSAGIGYLKFDPYGDTKDENGDTYYVWSTGELKDLPETEENNLTAKTLERDYNYETRLTDPSVNYSRSTYVIPLTFGISSKLSDNVYARVASTYNLTGSDYLDNTNDGGKKDKIISTNFTITYTIGKKADGNHHYKAIDFNTFLNDDSDNDGVKDIDDQCQQTPKETQVNGKGCPLDGDKDGVPDYLDLDLNTHDTAHVDEFGRALTDEHFLMRYMKRDSIFSHRIETLHEAPRVETLKQIDKEIDDEILHGVKLNLPEKFKFADYDKDGIIHSTEAFRALDEFLDGQLDVSITTLYELIDYFFEQ